jgi:hypothetical protein
MDGWTVGQMDGRTDKNVVSKVFYEKSLSQKHFFPQKRYFKKSFPWETFETTY